MKIQLSNNHWQSQNSFVKFNLFQLSFLSAVFLNLAVTLVSTAARATELTPPEPVSPSSQAELSPAIARETIETSALEASTGKVLSEVADGPGAIANNNHPDLSTPEVPSTALTPVPAGSPISQTVSTQASDLLGVSQPQQPEPQTLPQTETSTPAESTPASQPVNNPLIPSPGWRFDFEPYLFLPLDVQGNIFFGRGRNLLFPNRPGVILGNAGVNLDVNARLSDITAKLTNIFGASGRFQAWNGNFGIVSEGLYINSGFEGSSNGGTLTFRDRFNIPIPGFQIETKETLASFSLGASYRFLTVPFRTITEPANPSNYYPAISFEGLAGFRYLSVFQSADFARGPRFEFSGSEINPMIGGTARLMLSDKFALFFRGDTSNLGGGNLKQYYNLYAGLDWKFSGSFALRIAYRFNQIEFVKQGRFEGDNGLNLRSQGVQLGISWQF